MSNLSLSIPRSLCRAAFVLCLLGLGHTTQAITNSSTTAAFSSVGNFSSGLNGEQIAGNWVLTAAHVGAGLTPGVSTYTNGDGSSVIDQVYLFDGSNKFPDNDIALVHLSSAISSASIAALNDTVLDGTTTFGTIPTALGGPIPTVTIVNSQNATQRSLGVADPNNTQTTDGSGNTVNYLITSGDSTTGVNLQSGDSGSALYSGTVSDSTSSILLGVASGVTTIATTTQSYFVQVAAYGPNANNWINTTIANSGLSGSNQTVQWVSAVPETSSVLAMLLGVGGLWLLGQKRRAP